MSGHTPGPWRAVGCSVYADSPQDVDPSRFRGFREPEEPHGYLIAESIPHDATRRLIAAAPELLAALSDLVDRIEDMPGVLDDLHDEMAGAYDVLRRVGSVGAADMGLMPGGRE